VGREGGRLPADLRVERPDHDRPGPRAAAVFYDLRSRWHRRAQAEWDHMDEGATHPALTPSLSDVSLY
jgi:hypothetical protein